MNIDEIKAIIHDFLCHEILQQPALRLAYDRSLVQGGVVDSFALVNFALFAEDRFGIEIPDDDLTLENIDSINQIAAYVAGRLAVA